MPDSKFFYRFLWRATIVLLFVSAIARAEQLSVKTYTSADGLIYEGIYRLYQDSRGFIWFATPIGISRFDGYRFTNYGMEDGLFNTLINDFIEDDKGVYWLGSSSGGDYGAAIYRFDPRVKNSDEKKFIPFNIGGEEPATNNVNRLFKNSRGQIFVATDGGLFALDDAQTEKKFSRVALNVPASENQSFPVYSFAEDAEGNLWVGHENGLTRLLPDGRAATYEIRASDGAAAAFSLGFDNQNRLWIVTGKRTVTVFKPEPAGSVDFSNNVKRELRLETAFASGDLRDGFAYAFKPDETKADGAFGAVYCARDGRIFFGSRGKGLIEFDGANFRFYTRENGLSDNNVAFVREDSFGNLWLASSWGAMKITRRGFVTYNTADGLFADRISDLFTDRAGTIYAVNAGWNINQFDGRRFVSVRPNLPADLGGFWIHHIIKDSRDEWWIPTTKGLFRFPRVERIEQLATAQPIAVYTMRDGLAADNVLLTFEDSRGDIWFSYDNAPGRISRWERASGKFHHYAPENGIPEACRPFYYTEDAAGALLITCQFESYLVYRGDGRFTAHSTPEMKKGAWLHRALVDRKGRFWIGSPLNGLLRYDNPTSENPIETVYLKKDGLSSSHIQYLVEDLYGKIYYVTSSGMDRIDPETGEIKYYNVADGFPAAGTGVAVRGRDGALWLGTSRGLSKFIPEPDKQASSPPVFISHLRIAGNEVPVSVLGETQIPALTLAPDERQMQIDFYGLSLASGDTLRYQYKLEGVSDEWSPPTEQRTVNYPNLSSGSYRFTVRAVNPDGSFSSQPASISFTVLRPVWQRWWFLLLVALLIGAGVYALYRYRIAQLIKLERVRTRIATDLHDDIGSSLSQIAILSEVVRQKVGDNGAGEPLNMIAETSREMVDAMSDIVWAINPQKDYLNNLVQRMRRFAEDILDAQEIAYQFNSLENLKDVAVGSDVRREVYMIFKECVTNIVKHSGAAKVEFRINLENEFLVIEVNDNGRGFDPAQAENLDSLGGNGLINMRRRAENLGGSFAIDSAPGKGTRASLKIPILKKFFPV